MRAPDRRGIGGNPGQINSSGHEGAEAFPDATQGLGAASKICISDEVDAHYPGKHQTSEERRIEPVEQSEIVAFETLLEQDELRVEAVGGTAPQLVVSLTSVPLNPGEWPRKEFVKIARKGGENHMICVTERFGTWFNGDGIADQTAKAIGAYIAAHDIKHVSAVGVSMGGFNAIQLASLMKIDAVVALTPQYSVDPSVVPEEDRWIEQRSRIRNWPFRQIESFAPDTEFVIVHGDTEEEQRHWRRMPKADNVSHVILQGVGHKMDSLRQGGRLKRMVLFGILGDRDRFVHVARRAGGVPRDEFEASENAEA